VTKPFLHPLATTAFATGNKRMPASEGVQKVVGLTSEVRERFKYHWIFR